MGSLANPSSFFNGGGKISGDVELEGNLELSAGNTLSYVEDAGRQTLFNLPVTDSPSQGDEQSYAFQVDGSDILRVEAEADGAGGIQNLAARVPVEFIVTGDTTQVDDVVTGDIIVEDGNGDNLVRFDATVTPKIVDFFGNALENIGSTPGASAGAIRLGNSAPINARNNGDTADVRIAEVDGSDIIQLGDGGAAQVDVNPTLNFPNLTGTPSFSGHDHSEGGLTNVPNGGLANSSITLSTGQGMTGGGSISLGGSRSIDVAAGSFVTTGSDSVNVNIGNGLEGDGSDNIRVSGGAVADNGLVEGTNPHQISIATDGVGTDELDEGVSYSFTASQTFGSTISANGSPAIDVSGSIVGAETIELQEGTDGGAILESFGGGSGEGRLLITSAHGPDTTSDIHHTLRGQDDSGNNTDLLETYTTGRVEILNGPIRIPQGEEIEDSQPEPRISFFSTETVLRNEIGQPRYRASDNDGHTRIVGTSNEPVQIFDLQSNSVAVEYTTNATPDEGTLDIDAITNISNTVDLENNNLQRAGGSIFTANLSSQQLQTGEFVALDRVTVPADRNLFIYSVAIENDAFNAPAGLNIIIRNVTAGVNEASYNTTFQEGNPIDNLNVSGDNIIIAADNGNFGGGSGTGQVVNARIRYDIV